MKPASVVWIDGVEARLIHLSEEKMERRRLLGALPAGTIIDSDFYPLVAQELAHSHAILLVGPQRARDQFAQYLQRSAPRIALAVIGSIDGHDPSDSELARLASHHFFPHSD